MSISDKTRKLLWGRSGNCCAICKKELVIDATSSDGESIIGIECHIVSERPGGSKRRGGPRYDPAFPIEKIDSYGNLILLCPTDHKMIDDQYKTYTAERLRQEKSNHEKWALQKPKESPREASLKLKRIKQNIPEYMPRILKGKEILEINFGACSGSYDNDELQNEEEVNLIGSFFQKIKDGGDLGFDLEPQDRIRMEFELTQSIEELEVAGFFVFGAREIQKLEGGINGPTNWPVAHINVVRKTHDDIIKLPKGKE